MLDSLISSKTKIKILTRFFINLANNSHLRGLANDFQVSTNSIRNELNNLFKAGYLIRKKNQNKIVYSANKHHPLFNVLQKIVKNHLGLEDLINNVINNIGSVKIIILVGDYAKGIDSGKIEVIIIGDKIDRNYLNEIVLKIEEKIKRKIIFYLDEDIDIFPKLVIFKNQ
tara:strand:- start:79 stop:588 length:510 start_codon:yes stop_codon:yes gene_type:complete